LGITDQRPSLHKNLGLVYMGSVVLSAAAAYYLALNTGGGIGFGSGLAALATAWLLTTAMAFVAIKRQLYDQHKEWMIRSYVVTTAFVTFRMVFPLLQDSGIGSLPEQLAVAAWGCWADPVADLRGRVAGPQDSCGEVGLTNEGGRTPLERGQRLFQHLAGCFALFVVALTPPQSARQRPATRSSAAWESACDPNCAASRRLAASR
jgi:hypothetical protein